MRMKAFLGKREEGKIFKWLRNNIFWMPIYNLQPSCFQHYFETTEKIHFIFILKFVTTSVWQPQVKKFIKQSPEDLIFFL